jgi:cytochrome c2
MVIKQEVNAPLIFTVGVLSGLILLVMVFGMQAGFYTAERAETAKKWEQSTNTTWLEDLRREQARNIRSERWLDVENQIVTMPIDRAMDYVVAHQGRLPAPATVGPSTAPVIAPTTAAAVSLGNATTPKGLIGANPAVKRGKRLYTTLLCATCHTTNGARLIGPSLLNVVDREETFEDGTKAVAGEAYLRESILEPQKRVVKGFPPVMPVMKGKLTNAELDDLLAYLRFLSPKAARSVKDP